MVLSGLAVSRTGARSMVIPSDRMADPWLFRADSTWAGVHWAAIWRGEGSAPMTLERRAMGPPSSSVDIHGTTWPGPAAAAFRPAIPDRMVGPEPAAGWPKSTNPPTPAAASGAEAPRSAN